MTVTAALLLLAALAQVAIALVLLWVLGQVRVPMVLKGEVRIRDVALSREPWPEREKKVSNAFDNQFQLPVLFYVAVAVSLYLGAGWIEAVLAWLFVISRIAHAVIFVTTNTVAQRFTAYTAGYVVLVLLWLWLVIRVFLSLGSVT